MSSYSSFRLSPTVLEWARVSMGYSIAQAAKKAGVSDERFEQWEKGERSPTYKQLENLAEHVYKRPLALLLAKAPPLEDPVNKDFRNIGNRELKHLSPEIRLALRKAKRYQLILEEVASKENTPLFRNFAVSTNEIPAKAAMRFRIFLNFSVQQQQSWAKDKAFNEFKSLVESIGIYVFHMKMPFAEARAFCLTGDYPIIVLNTDDAKNGRIFSMFHEVCHIFFNVNGIFKDFNSGELKKEYEAVEEYCNQFASAFLVPEQDFSADLNGLTEVNNTSENYIHSLAQKYNVSNEVIARKLLARHLISTESFWNQKRLWDNIAREAKQRENAKLKEQESSGRAQDIKIFYEKGKPYVETVISAYQQGTISSSDASNYLETKFNHINKLIQRLSS